MTRRGFLLQLMASGYIRMPAYAATPQAEEIDRMRNETPGLRARPETLLGRLTARPTLVTVEAPTGLHPLTPEATREGLRYVPVGYRVTHPAPLVILLHGAGGDAQHGLAPLLPLADAAGLILLAPVSRGLTWDIILGTIGPDVRVLNQALQQTFQQYAVDPTHIAVGGFSDGASYALSIGLANGDLFTHIIAFSPGFTANLPRHGSPRLFLSHGVHDTVLPIDACSRRLVPELRRSGYTLCYHEFDGPHTVPAAVAREAVTWFTTDAGCGR